MTAKRAIELDVNGRVYAIEVEPRVTLADALREHCKLTGTHVGCEQGVCGACTVLVDGAALRSCLMFAVQADGLRIRTIEDFGAGSELDPIQRAFVAQNALQCGFCTPGFVLLVAAALQRQPPLSEAEIIPMLSANLCRCTGYQSIIAAVTQLVRERRARGS